MEINYIIGSKKEFFEFIHLITLRDKVAILSDSDLDGLASAVFLEEILKAKNIELNYLEFMERGKDMLKEVLLKLKAEGITKVFVSDIGIDSIDPEGFEEMKKEMDVFLIDHHPFDENLLDKRNIIKTASDDCSAMVCYFLGDRIIDSGAWEWLVCSAIFSDYSYKNENNFNFLKSIYPEVTEENISSSTPGMNGRKINSALIYYERNKKYVYNLVKERKLDEIQEVHEIIEGEIDKLIEDFSLKGKHYEEKKLHFYEIESRFNIVSTVSSLISKMRPEDAFICMQKKEGGIIKFSARNQGGTIDVSLLMKKCVEGLEGAAGGGHKAASAAKIQEKDLEEFMMRLLE
jgi:single-stranded DNA-specific DHH superfamily exonuclease